MYIKDIIIKLINQGFTNEQISDITGYNIKKILSHLTKYKIKSNKFIKIVETEELKQFMIGSLMGDGCIPKLGKYGKEYGISFAHKKEHKDFIYFKYDFLSKYKLTNKIFYNKIENIRYKNGFTEEYRFKSKTNPYFSKYRNIFYKEKKVVPEIIKDINEFGLAIWYMDDGYVTNASCNIATNSFTYNENLYLINVLKNKFDLKFTLQKCSGTHKLYLAKKDFQKFVSLIDPYIIDIMKYKLKPYNNRES